jgi:peptidoglycan/xylan/chitin deacetylase (PgdA/CDA1 family)
MHGRGVLLAAWTALGGGVAAGCSGEAAVSTAPLLASPAMPLPTSPAPPEPPHSPDTATSASAPGPPGSVPESPADTNAPTQAAATEAPAPPQGIFVHPVVDREQSVVRVLMYHSFGWFSVQRPAVSPYSLRTQLEWMRDHQVEVIRVSQLVAFLAGNLRLPARAAVITIDDGEQNAYTVAYPMLARFEAPFALAAPTEAVIHQASRGTVTWEQVREMLESGLCELIAHGHTHADLTALDGSALQQELFEPRALLEQHVGVGPDTLAYPLGAHSDALGRQVRAAGYSAAFVAQGGPVTYRTPRFAIPRYAVEKDTNIFAFAYFFRHPG